MNNLHPKHLLERRRALDTFQQWPASELSSIKQAFPNPRLQANLTPRWDYFTFERRSSAIGGECQCLPEATSHSAARVTLFGWLAI
jgi:hypothetical protein